MFTEKEKEFLIGLTELSRKTGIIVTGCGCCGSPSLSDIGEEPKTEIDKKINGRTYESLKDDRCGYGHIQYNQCDFEWIYEGDFKDVVKSSKGDICAK